VNGVVVYRVPHGKRGIFCADVNCFGVVMYCFEISRMRSPCFDSFQCKLVGLSVVKL